MSTVDRAPATKKGMIVMPIMTNRHIFPMPIAAIALDRATPAALVNAIPNFLA